MEVYGGNIQGVKTKIVAKVTISIRLHFLGMHDFRNKETLDHQTNVDTKERFKIANITEEIEGYQQT
jgi:hypothetical protein